MNLAVGAFGPYITFTNGTGWANADGPCVYVDLGRTEDRVP